MDVDENYHISPTTQSGDDEYQVGTGHKIEIYDYFIKEVHNVQQTLVAPHNWHVVPWGRYDDVEGFGTNRLPNNHSIAVIPYSEKDWHAA